MNVGCQWAFLIISTPRTVLISNVVSGTWPWYIPNFHLYPILIPTSRMYWHFMKLLLLALSLSNSSISRLKPFTLSRSFTCNVWSTGGWFFARQLPVWQCICKGYNYIKEDIRIKSMIQNHSDLLKLFLPKKQNQFTVPFVIKHIK